MLGSTRQNAALHKSLLGKKGRKRNASQGVCEVEANNSKHGRMGIYMYKGVLGICKGYTSQGG